MSNTTTPFIFNVSYVKASELFEDHADIWNDFVESDPDFSWGTNDHTLIDPHAIIDHFDNSNMADTPELQELIEIITNLPNGVFIDLEG